MEKIEMKVLIGLHRNVSKFDKMTSGIASQYGVTFSQFMVLEALYSKGDMTIGEVRDHILSSVGTIPLIVKNLEKRNYIERRSDENDRRKCILHLTDEGYKVISKIAPKNEEMIMDYLSVLDENELKELNVLLKKIGGRFDEKTSKNKGKRL